ncbi:MAG: glycosyltransferase family 39 protein [Streptosporangiaceae bacterium]
MPKPTDPASPADESRALSRRPRIGPPPDRAEPLAAMSAAGTATAGMRPAPAARRSLAAGTAWWQRIPAWCWLIGILSVQAALSLRLLHADTAFEDEAEYLWAGHLMWAHWLHGASTPSFSAYFSGAPAVYPPIGALADSLGGLAAARELSLIFMLGATALLWATASRLFGSRAAFFAAALFAACGPTLHLGAYATYDPMSMFLVALATWLTVRAGERQDATGWMAAAGAALALANAAAYSTALFDPIVIAVAVLVALPRPGGKAAAARAAVLAVVCAALLAAGLLAGGSSYLSGVRQTVLTRAGGAQSPLTVLAQSWAWGGLVVVLAGCAIVASRVSRDSRWRFWLLTVLGVAGLLGPLEHARLHTTTSLVKHVDLGVWFAAAAAGYAVDRLVDAALPGKPRNIALASCVIALAFPVAVGAAQARQFATSWPNAASFVAVFGPLADHSTGRLLVEDPSVAEYYLPAGRDWKRWSSTRNIILPSGASTGGPSSQAGVTGAGNIGVYAEYVTSGYFSYVALNYADTTTFDLELTHDLRRSHRYRVAQVIPYGPGRGTYVVYQLKPRR